MRKFLKMKVLLSAALIYLVSATEEPLLFSGNFTTIYLASKVGSVTDENSEVRMLMREVNYFKDYTLMSMMFYVRKNGKCQLHKVWADKVRFNHCYKKYYFNIVKCHQRNGTENIIGTWKFRDSYRHFSHIYYDPRVQGGLTRKPSDFKILIHFVSNTTILFEAWFINQLGNMQRLTGALERRTNITEQMWREYVNLTRQLNIPTENIKNVYEADECPKLDQ